MTDTDWLDIASLCEAFQYLFANAGNKIVITEQLFLPGSC